MDAMQYPHTAQDAIEWGAVRRGNGFIHLRANVYKGHSHGLRPEWNGAGCYHAIKFLCLAH